MSINSKYGFTISRKPEKYPISENSSIYWDCKNNVADIAVINPA